MYDENDIEVLRENIHNMIAYRRETLNTEEDFSASQAKLTRQ